MKSENLIGLWSIDMLYGPGAQEDTWLAFRRDGTGWIAFLHYRLCELDTFFWSLSDDCVLTITGDRYQCPPEPETQSTFSFADLAISIAPRVTPSYGEVTVLSFGQQIWCGESEFALVSREEERLHRPVFDNDALGS